MHPKVEELALRFKGVLDGVEAGRQRVELERERLMAEGRQARAALFKELAAFGRAVGHLTVESREDHLALSWGSQRLSFVPVGEGDQIRVNLGNIAGPADDGPEGMDGAIVRIHRHPDLGNAWVLGVSMSGQVEEVEPLFDAGLVHLLTEGLGLPTPDAGPGEPQPPLDELSR